MAWTAFVRRAECRSSFSDDNGKPWSTFIQQSPSILQPLGSWPYENIENAAKNNWRASLSALDSSAQKFMSTLSDDYDQNSSALPRGIVSLPAPPSDSNTDGGNGPSGNPKAPPPA